MAEDKGHCAAAPEQERRQVLEIKSRPQEPGDDSSDGSISSTAMKASVLIQNTFINIPDGYTSERKPSLYKSVSMPEHQIDAMQELTKQMDKLMYKPQAGAVHEMHGDETSGGRSAPHGRVPQKVENSVEQKNANSQPLRRKWCDVIVKTDESLSDFDAVLIDPVVEVETLKGSATTAMPEGFPSICLAKCKTVNDSVLDQIIVKSPRPGESVVEYAPTPISMKHLSPRTSFGTPPAISIGESMTSEGHGDATSVCQFLGIPDNDDLDSHSDCSGADEKNAIPECEMTEEIAAKIPKDENGNLLSVGSMCHDEGTCKACVFFHNPSKGCKNGVRCLFCHHFHAPKKRIRWSKKKRQEALQQLQGEWNGELSEGGCASHLAMNLCNNSHLLASSPPSPGGQNECLMIREDLCDGVPSVIHHPNIREVGGGNSFSSAPLSASLTRSRQTEISGTLSPLTGTSTISLASQHSPQNLRTISLNVSAGGGGGRTGFASPASSSGMHYGSTTPYAQVPLLQVISSPNSGYSSPSSLASHAQSYSMVHPSVSHSAQSPVLVAAAAEQLQYLVQQQSPLLQQFCLQQKTTPQQQHLQQQLQYANLQQQLQMPRSPMFQGVSLPQLIVSCPSMLNIGPSATQSTLQGESKRETDEAQRLNHHLMSLGALTQEQIKSGMASVGRAALQPTQPHHVPSIPSPSSLMSANFGYTPNTTVHIPCSPLMSPMMGHSDAVAQQAASNTYKIP